MELLAIVFVMALMGQALAVDIIVENPPRDLVQGEFSFIPHTDGKFYRVHTESALTEPFPHFELKFGVFFRLNTLANPTEPQDISALDVDSLKNSHFNASRPTRINIHGWNNYGTLGPIISEAYLLKGKHNINCIEVNWQAGSDTINYIAARQRVPDVGQFVAQFIDFLAVNAGLNLDDVHIVGHSLGAHVAGYVGKHVQSGTIRKIVGLDPAAPLFKFDKEKRHLTHSDAQYVEIIHTNAGTLGVTHPIGTASFYPNGGSVQPGCGFDPFSICAHKRSYEFFAESLYTDQGFFAHRCSSFENLQRGFCHIMENPVHLGGEPGNLDAASGVYFVKTNDQRPFARGLPTE